MATLALTYRNPSLDNTLTLVAAGNYNLVAWNLINPGASGAYLKLFNAAATGDVTVGTTTPVKTLFIPGNGTAFLSNEPDLEDSFTLGLVLFVTGGMADADNTAPSANCYVEIKYLQNH